MPGRDSVQHRGGNRFEQALDNFEDMHVGSLQDITVLDFSHALSGPFATLLMSELGARILKIESPGGDHFRPANGGATFAVVNRNKHGLCVDLKHPRSGDVIARLARAADVVVENFTPGTADRLGIGYAQLSVLNPSLVYCSISGFGSTGPYREFRGYDAVAQAMSGIMASTGEPERPPVRVGPSMIDMGTGMYVVIAMLDALRTRDATGLGAHLELNLLDSALSWMSQGIARYSQTGQVPARTGSALGTFSPYQVFAGRDGLMFIGVSTEAFWGKLCTALDLDVIDDPRFCDMQSRVSNRDALTALIESRLHVLSNDDVLKRLRDAGVPCAPVLDVAGVVEDTHVQATGALVSVHDPVCGDILQTKMPIGAGVTPTAAPQLGEHTRQVLLDSGFDSTEIAALIDARVVIADA